SRKGAAQNERGATQQLFHGSSSNESTSQTKHARYRRDSANTLTSRPARLFPGRITDAMAEGATGLSAWESFYVIVGSSGGARIGLQFVVMTLVGESRLRTQTAGLAAFSTPTIVHLTGALVVSAIMSAPWPSLGPLSMALGICGIGGLTYAVIVLRRTMRQTDYQPLWEDWLWY